MNSPVTLKPLFGLRMYFKHVNPIFILCFCMYTYVIKGIRKY
jgi:hypothetical protein